MCNEDTMECVVPPKYLPQPRDNQGLKYWYGVKNYWSLV
jgi:hypothetical protein